MDGSSNEMSLAGNEELDLFRRAVADFLDDRATPEKLDAWREAGVVDREVWREAGAIGMLVPSAPEQYGGAGADFRFERIVIEEIGRRGLEGFAVPLHGGIVAPYVLHLTDKAQKQRWIPGIVNGDIVLAVAMSEPGAGSDLRAIRTQAVRDGDDYVINGQKTFISNGQIADLVIVACKTGEGAISLIAVEGDRAGFVRGRNLAKMGREAQDTSELFFDNVRVPAANLLGGVEGRGFEQMTAFLPQERITIAVMGQAMMDRAIDLTLAYTRDRTAFGKPLFEFQNTRFVLADAKTQATASRALLDMMTDRLLAGTLTPADAAIVKLFVSEASCKVIDNCVQLFGGYGYMDEYPISRLYRDVRIDRIHGGTSEIMKTIIARAL
jgi:acyl-CoA dehydrogenase